jgi:hypothetical protein
MSTDELVVVVHRSCGHIGQAVPKSHRHLAEGQHKLLAAAGYHQWRVRVEAVTDEMLSRCLVVCDVCRVDPSRGLLPSVLAAQLSDPEVRDVAAYGAAIHHALVEGGDTSP